MFHINQTLSAVLYAMLSSHGSSGIRKVFLCSLFMTEKCRLCIFILMEVMPTKLITDWPLKHLQHKICVSKVLRDLSLRVKSVAVVSSY